MSGDAAEEMSCIEYCPAGIMAPRLYPAVVSREGWSVHGDRDAADYRKWSSDAASSRSGIFGTQLSGGLLLQLCRGPAITTRHDASEQVDRLRVWLASFTELTLSICRLLTQYTRNFSVNHGRIRSNLSGSKNCLYHLQ